MTSSARERLTARIVWRVQGVGYRWWVVAQAADLGLVGWVANGDQERCVDLVAEGDAMDLAEFARRLQRGPPGSRVDRVDVARGPAGGEFASFQIRPG